MYDAEGSPNYTSIINGLLDRLSRNVRTQFSLADGTDLATREHALILEAYESGDAEGAAKLTYDHVQGAKASLINYLKIREYLDER
jgi:DNA-binding GntR family transcriptional regulator